MAERPISRSMKSGRSAARSEWTPERYAAEFEKLQQKLRATEAELHEVEHAKNEFLSRMSLELRTSLDAILGFAQLLDMEQLESEDQRDSVEQILKAGRHLIRLVDDVSDIAHVQAGRLALNLESIDVSELIDEEWDLLRPRALQHRIRREDAGTASRLVRADRKRLKQVMVNLMSNAIRYTPDGGIVQIACIERRVGHLTIMVTDSGSGVPLDKREGIFRPFDPLDARQPGIEGTGISLSLSKILIEAMGGEIGLHGEPARGSTFWIELPLAVEDAERDGVGSADDEDLGEVPGIRTVLYIEDSPSSFDLMRRLLARRPTLRLLSAGIQGGFGIELAAEHQPDLILLDLNLPNTSGEELLQRLHAEAGTEHIPIIVLSSEPSAAQRDRLVAGGAAGYLPRPIDVEQFLRAVDRVMATPN
jgi:CheY-like chemotaxis protein